MRKKIILLWFLGIISFSLLFGYSLVFAGPQAIDTSTEVVFKLSDNVYMGSLKLKNTKILFKSGENIENFKIKGTCNTHSKLLYNKGDYYMFDLRFFDESCSDKFELINDIGEKKASFELNMISEYELLSRLLDIKTTRLIRLKNSLERKVSMLQKYETFDEKTEDNYYNYLEKKRELEESIYNIQIIKNVIEARNEKYIVPVAGHIMPTTAVKVPNSSRSYRKDFTDGIHHGWDIDGDFGEQVIALDDGIIIRSVKEFDFSDLSKIVRGENLSYETQMRNLDILRGKQVWLKTMSGDLVMYSHLNDVFANVKAGEIVKKGQPLGTIGITGVPDKNYKDYHLHFVVHNNPFIEENIGNYDFDDYMQWPWLFKGETSSYIIENQSKFFQ